MPQADVNKKLRKLIDKLTPQLVVAGLKESEINRFNPETKPQETVEDYIEAVTALTVKGGAYHDFMGIYGLKPPVWWDNMKMLGETDLREHKLLRAEAKKLKHAWRQLHVKAKIAEPDATEGNLEGVGLRPEV